MQVHVLGDIAIQPPGGERRPISSPRPRLILAMLARVIGRTVTEGQLIDAIWGETPPSSARTALQTYLSTLRDELEQDRARRSAGSFIETSAAGYVLRADRCTVDALEFERAVVSCAENWTSGADGADAVAQRLDEALEEWAEPFAEFGDDPWAIGTSVRLRERHASAVELRADIALDRGAAAGVIDRLHSAVELHPFRERLHEQLMVALYRAGDQAGALDVSARLRRRLLDDLGLDPGAAIVAVERRILDHDHSLFEQRSEGPGAAAVVAPARPRRLPPPMVGRRDVFDQVVDLVGAHRAVTLVGPGGIGKTLLAEHVSHERSRFVELDVVVDLDDLPGVEESDIVRAVAVALDVTEQPGSDLLTSIADAGRGRSAMLRIETAELAPAAVAAVVDGLADAPDLHVLSTSQVPLRCTGERVVRLDGLPPEDAVALLARGRDGHDTELLGRIADHLDGVPLALELAAARLDAFGAADTLAQLRRGVAPSAGASRPARHRSIAAASSWSLGLLAADEVSLLTALATHAAPFTLRVARHTWGVEPLAPGLVESLMSVLVDRSLVQRIDADPFPSYRLLDAIREATLERAADVDVEAHFARLDDVVVDAAQAMLFQMESPVSVDELAGEVTQTLDRLHAARDPRELVLAGCLALWWAGRSRAAEGSELIGRALRTHPDAPDMIFGPTAGVASLLSYVRGDMHQTRERLALMGERGEAWLVPTVRHTVEASVAFLDRRYDDAAKSYGETLKHYGEPTGPKLLMIWLGANSLWYAGHLAEAQAQYRRLRQEADSIDDRHNVATALRFDAMVTSALGDLERAWRLAERGLAASRQLGDPGSAGQGEVAVAVVARALDDGATAERHALAAIEATLGPFDLFTQRSAPVLVAAHRLEQGDAESAALALGWYLDYLDRTGQPAAVATAGLATECETRARDALGRAAFAKTAAHGAALRLRELLDALRA